MSVRLIGFQHALLGVLKRDGGEEVVYGVADASSEVAILAQPITLTTVAWGTRRHNIIYLVSGIDTACRGARDLCAVRPQVPIGNAPRGFAIAIICTAPIGGLRSPLEHWLQNGASIRGRG